MITLIKRTRTTVALALVGVLYPYSSMASGTLEPCRNVFAEPAAPEQETIRELLLPGRTLWATNPAARVVALPSFEPEWVVSLYITPDSSTVVLRSAETLIAAQPAASGAEGSIASVEIEEVAAPIDPELAILLRDTWKRELLSLAPPQSEWTSDGITYHVSAWVQGYGLLCGETLSAAEGAHVTARAAEILRSFVTDEANRPEMEAELWKLLSKAKEADCRGEDSFTSEPAPSRFDRQAPASSEVLRAWSDALSDSGSIELLHPRDRGLFVIRSEASDTGAVFGSYATDDPGETKTFDLKLGLAGGVDWRTVADSRRGNVARVEPGVYRLVINYLAPRPQSEGEGVVVCVAVSPPFRVEEPFNLHRFE